MIRHFDDLTYTEYFTLFRLAKAAPSRKGNATYFLEQSNDTDSPRMHIIMRSGAHSHVVRIRSVRPSQGELFYLHVILQTKLCRSFRMARTVENTEYSSFQEAAGELGLFADRNEATYAMLEAIQNLRTPHELRVLFVHLLVNECVDSPLALWESVQENLALDFTLKNNNSLELGLNFALDDISHLLEEYGKRPGDFALPEATIHTREHMHYKLKHNVPLESSTLNNILYSPKPSRPLQMAYHSASSLMEKQAVAKRPSSTPSAINYGQWVALLFQQRHPHLPHNFIVGGEQPILHLKHQPNAINRVPVNNKNEMLESPIDPSDPRGELIREAALIIWDEAPMANRAVLSCVEETCRRVMGNDLPFGGKVIFLLGDFRQTCPVI
ncbi:PIF1-like helicase-domain-containing protein [Mycena galopus ATCC 62051]|nr:PIF1-like helicase-domain-containing protein [Mycena galopus ATCC 62051]